LDALPERGIGKRRLPTIPGVVPGQYDRPEGCLFNPRCTMATQHCRTHAPLYEVYEDHAVRCHTPIEPLPSGPNEQQVRAKS